MFALQQLFSKEDDFFDLLEGSAEQARQSVEALNRVLATPAEAPRLQEFRALNEACKLTSDRINEALVRSIVTQLDRDDIELLSAVLYRIPKTVERCAERFLVSTPMVADADFSRHVRLLEAATSQVVRMVEQLRSGVSVEGIREMNNLIQRIEGEADDLILEVLQDLYSGRHDVTRVIAMRDVFELLEKVIDRCRDAGNAVTHIILKNA